MTIYSRFIVATLFGMSVSHLIFSFLVLQSNIAVFKVTTDLISAGYLTVPNTSAVSYLESFKTAFCGAIFFTLTAGSFISLLSAFFAVLSERLIERKTAVLIMGLMICAGVFLFNYNGWNLTLTVVILFVPLITLEAFVLLPERRTAEFTSRPFLIQAVSLIVLLVILMSVFMKSDKAIFIDFRDKILFSNKVGQVINDYYYKYTLYPAEVIKSTRQKTLVPVYIEENSQHFRHTERILRNRDYLNNFNKSHASIIVSFAGKMIHLSDNDGKNSIESSLSDFYSDPDKVLKNFSQKTDTLGAFRLFILVSLLTSFPLIVYLMVHYLLFLGAFLSVPVIKGMFKKRVPTKKRSFLRRLTPFADFDISYHFATVLLSVIAILLFILLTQGSVVITSGKQLRSYLADDAANLRISALQYISRNKKKYARAIMSYDSHRLKNAGVTEKYWFANAAAGRANHYADDIIRLLKESQVNIKCQALYALGSVDKKISTKYLKAVLKSSDHWYVQWYAYRSLRHTGWRQPSADYKE